LVKTVFKAHRHFASLVFEMPMLDRFDASLKQFDHAVERTRDAESRGSACAPPIKVETPSGPVRQIRWCSSAQSELRSEPAAEIEAFVRRSTDSLALICSGQAKN
jgi:hypothetical protein